MILVSPSEPQTILTLLGDVALTHSMPEQHGADYLFFNTNGSKVGVQRKEVNDLLRSLEDGRLVKEVAALRRLQCAVLLVEGPMDFPAEGPGYTRRQVRNLLRSVAGTGVRVEHTADLEDTAAALLEMLDYYRKPEHTSMFTRPKAVKNDWKLTTDRDWGMFLLQSFPGIGPVLAGAIFDRFGRVPLAWTCSEKELREVEGIGRKRARELMRSLEGF